MFLMLRNKKNNVGLQVNVCYKQPATVDLCKFNSYFILSVAETTCMRLVIMLVLTFLLPAIIACMEETQELTQVPAH